jgi:outer membrane murein-binding lipoprotein Lpp
MLELNATIIFFAVLTLNKENNMKKIVKLSMIALIASLVVGCASTSDIENLQSQVDGLKTSVAQASSDAASAQSAAADAASKAGAAESAANRAAQYAQDTNSKLDSMFKKSMMK